MMARILEVAPGTEAIDIDMRSRWEELTPFAFCSELAPFVVDAVRRGDTDVALRIVNELNTGLASGDGYATNCVSIGFLEPQFESNDDPDEWPPSEKVGLRSDEMAEFVETWLPEIKAELRWQVGYQEKMRRKEGKLWGPQQPDGSGKLTLRWKLRHPILLWKLRHGVIRIAG